MKGILCKRMRYKDTDKLLNTDQRTLSHIEENEYLNLTLLSTLLASSYVTPINDSLLMAISWSPGLSRPSYKVKGIKIFTKCCWSDTIDGRHSVWESSANRISRNISHCTTHHQVETSLMSQRTPLQQLHPLRDSKVTKTTQLCQKCPIRGNPIYSKAFPEIGGLGMHDILAVISLWLLNVISFALGPPIFKHN